MAPPPTDESLVRSAQAGSIAAFSTLMARYERTIFLFLCRMTDGPDDAEDCTQDTFLKAWMKVNQCRDGTAFKSWLYAIAARIALDRRESRNRALERDTTWADLVRSSASAGDGDACIDLQRALSELPDKDRAVAALVFGAELTHTEAAQALSMPLGSVKTRIARSKKHLETALKIWRPDYDPGGNTGQE